MQVSKSALYLLSLVAVWSALEPGTAEGQKPPKRERNLIAREELVQASDKFAYLYEAIRRLRPHFLTMNNRGARTLGNSGSINAGAPVVYVDGNKSGAPDFLQTIQTKDVAEVRYLSPNEAGMEFGLGHEAGAILVKLFKETG